MKYFLDTEFAEAPHSIHLISLGIVAENGREFYAECEDFDLSVCNPWVRKNVVPHLWSQREDRACTFSSWIGFGGRGGILPKGKIGSEVKRWIGDDKPEFWGYYADYDWVAFCWLFGAMIDLPKGWPMYCRDIKQLCDSLGNPQLPKQELIEHHALADARWNKLTWEYLNETYSLPSPPASNP